MYDFALPPTVKGEQLDNYLSQGWFRCSSIMYTIDGTYLDDIEYPVHWLRYNVKAVSLCKKNTKLISENSRFSTQCRPLELNSEIETLYRRYSKSIEFEISPLETIIGDNTTFDSHIIEIRDNGRLIATGIFDVGKNSMEGMINFYDPAYKKHSLGKYLMLIKYQYCLENGYDYYYPGFYIPGQQVLSYKLFLDNTATEVYLREANTWIPYYEFEKQIH